MLRGEDLGLVGREKTRNTVGPRAGNMSWASVSEAAEVMRTMLMKPLTVTKTAIARCSPNRCHKRSNRDRLFKGDGLDTGGSLRAIYGLDAEA